MLEWLQLRNLNYGIEVTFNGMTSLLNFIKIHQLVQKLIVGGRHRQDDDLISLLFSLGRKVRYKSVNWGQTYCGWGDTLADTHKLNVVVEFTLLLGIRELSGSNLRPETVYPV
jgi:hypothetical protein